jgi:hypothetical protein
MKINPMKAIKKMVQGKKEKAADKLSTATSKKTAAKATVDTKLQAPESTRSVRVVQFKSSPTATRTYAPGTAPALPADRPWSHRPVLDNELRRLDQKQRDDFEGAIKYIEKMHPGLAAEVFSDRAVKTLQQGLDRMVDSPARKPVDTASLGIDKRVQKPIFAETQALPVSLSPVPTMEADEDLRLCLIGAHKKANANKLIAAVEKDGALVFVPVSKDDLGKPGYRQGVERAARVLREQPQFFDSLGHRSGPVTQGELFNAVTGGDE